MGEGVYIHGFTADEQGRLSRMQELLNEQELVALELDGVDSVLEVGAGLGQMARAMARGTRRRVVGVERDGRQLAAAAALAQRDGESGLVDLRQGDATALPLAAAERGTFDLAHARFVLEHVPDPLAVVREMVGAVRPDGGRVVLLDDDHELLRLWPALPSVAAAWEAYWKGYRALGCDPLVGRRLVELLVDAGARPVRVTTIPYGGCQGTPQFAGVVDNLAGVLTGSADVLDERGVLTRDAIATAIRELREWAQRPASTLWYSLPLAEGRRAAAAGR